jgi:hypothetical protein
MFHSGFSVSLHSVELHDLARVYTICFHSLLAIEKLLVLVQG